MSVLKLSKQTQFVPLTLTCPSCKLQHRRFHVHFDGDPLFKVPCQSCGTHMQYRMLAVRK